MGETREHSRWLVAVMGTILMIVLGTVYSWSFFQKPIVETYGWTNSGVAWVFSTNILFLGLSAAWSGINLPKYGPARLAVIGAVMYGTGFMLASFALSVESLPLLILGFGVVGGWGIGMSYVTPVISASKWFPDKQGFVTGMVVMGFGFGALLMSKIIAPVVLKIADGNLVFSFFMIGALILLFGFFAALFIKQPPAGYLPKGYTPAVKISAGDNNNSVEITAKQAIFTSKFAMIWVVFFVNITAGIMFISFQSPMMQDLWSRYSPGSDPVSLAAIGGTLIAISSIFNGIGRFFWGGVSDKIGRIQTFRLILASQLIVFVTLLFITNPYIFALLVCYVLLCYGGGFGTIPAYIREVFSERLMPVVYGTILTAWSAGGVVGPQIVGFMKDNFPQNAANYAFSVGSLLLATGFVLTLFLNNNSIFYKTK
ncbi:MAG: MFS transporter [Bacteroidetes bacterium HGW-Bacteroidetes-8]|nr:MAG: MFS transporter [Bacteroidetes bacterium HGW-Bacteroidetes-8]